MPEYKSQGGKIGFFTLMISEIDNQKMEISSALKICDKSDKVSVSKIFFLPIDGVCSVFMIA
jgi:hypothetical protein